MSKTRNLSDLLDANGDVKSTALDNVPASDVVNDTTPQLGGDLASNGNNINIADNDRINVGASNDLQIYHTGSDSWIYENGTGDFKLATNGPVIRLQKGTTEIMADFKPDSGVDLYHDNSKKFETTSAGVFVTGNISTGDNGKFISGTSADLQIYHDGTHSYIHDNGTGNLKLRATNFRVTNSADTETLISADDNGNVQLYYDNSVKLATTSSGATVTGTLSATAFSGDGSALTGISGGKVGQILSTTYGTSTGITSTSFVDTGMSANITPSATSSKILVMFQCTAHLSRSNQEVGAQFRLIRDSSVAFWTGAGQTYYQGAFGSVSNNQMAVTQIFSYLDSPNSTSSLNYKLQAAVNSGGGHSVTAQAGNTASVMTLMEILA